MSFLAECMYGPHIWLPKDYHRTSFLEFCGRKRYIYIYMKIDDSVLLFLKSLYNIFICLILFLRNTCTIGFISGEFFSS